jgi:hypothetical protein
MLVELVLPGLSTSSDPSRRRESVSEYHQVGPASDEACRLDEPSRVHLAPAPRRHGAYERWLLARDIQRGGGGGQSVEWFFDHVSHYHLQRFLAHRISDHRLLRIIERFLKAGVWEDGVVGASEQGTPQGGLVSPVLANIYLHYTLDLWFEKRYAKSCRGKAHLVRFADDCAPRRREGVFMH